MTALNQTTQGAIRTWWFKNLLFLGLSGAVLFLLAGQIRWPLAWAYLGATLLVILANAALLDPSLLVERSELQAGTKPWDIFLATFVALLGPLLTLIISGLDRRFAWSQFSLPPFQIAALLVFLLSALLGTWAMAANKFFSATVRIQDDRQHQVISSGPYRYVRHPGYTSGIFASLMTPLILGSWLGLIPALLVAAAYIVRAALEDQVLQNELRGYQEYAQKVRCRLLPWLW